MFLMLQLRIVPRVKMVTSLESCSGNPELPTQRYNWVCGSNLANKIESAVIM